MSQFCGALSEFLSLAFTFVRGNSESKQVKNAANEPLCLFMGFFFGASQSRKVLELTTKYFIVFME